MADSYEIEAQREIADVDPTTGDLLDYWEITARAKPSGAVFSVRVPVKGADPAEVAGLLAARAAQFAALEAF